MTDQLQMELGTLLDRLSEAARLLDDGDVAPTETLRAMYRDCIHDAMNRLRSESAHSAALQAIVKQWREKQRQFSDDADMVDIAREPCSRDELDARWETIKDCADRLDALLHVSAQDRTIPHDN